MIFRVTSRFFFYRATLDRTTDNLEVFNNQGDVYCCICSVCLSMYIQGLCSCIIDPSNWRQQIRIFSFSYQIVQSKIKMLLSNNFFNQDKCRIPSTTPSLLWANAVYFLSGLFKICTPHNSLWDCYLGIELDVLCTVLNINVIVYANP